MITSGVLQSGDARGGKLTNPSRVQRRVSFGGRVRKNARLSSRVLSESCDGHSMYLTFTQASSAANTRTPSAWGTLNLAPGNAKGALGTGTGVQ
jgi:hypothetical protein